MSKLFPLPKLIVIVLGCLLNPAIVIAVPMRASSTASSLDNLLHQPTSYPGCSEQDYYWYQKSGPDLVIESPVKSSAVIVEADKITGQQNGTHYAQGHVLGYKDDKTIVADWLTYDQKSAHATGGGNIVLTRQYDTLQGKWVDYYLDLDKGTVRKASAFQAKTNMYAEGEQINVFNKKEYQVESAYFTTCDPKNPAWHIEAQQVNFDYQNSMGNARYAKFYVQSVPVAAAPYFMFPLGERKSGFLTPTFGSNTNTGTFVGLPYYWNMAPNYDMTITPEIYSRSGFLISDQFRYLTEQGKGEIYTEQVPNQWSDGKYRYYYHLTDTHNLESNVAVGYNYNQVSDNNYFVDFGNFNSTVDNINLDQSVFANYKPQWGFVGIKAQQFQTLQPTGPSGPVATAPIYSTLPQVNLNIQPQAIGQTPFQVNFISQYSNFYSTAMQSGQRAVIYPSITMPLKKAWGYITPKFGYNYTNYQLSPFPNQQAGYNGINRTIPISSIDSGLYFERPLTLGSTSYAQTLEPRLYYLYIPEVDQSKIPLFDTAPATYNLNQLFSENRFSGYDRINLANDLTMGVTSRLINDNTGVEMANWGIGYRYYITPENDFAYGNYTQYQQLYLPQPNAIAELGNKWTKAISTNASFQYNTMYNEIDAYSLQLKYNPEDYKIVNMRFGYQYQTPLLYYAYTPGQAYTPAAYEDQYVLDLSGQWPLFSNRWFVEGRANYDFTAKTFLNALGGIQYNGGCWAVHAVMENYITNLNQYTQAYFVQFELKGLTSLGSGDPTSDLRLNIPGYVPVTSIH